MTIHRLLTLIIYAAIICGAIGHIGYLWPELTPKERVWLCVRYGIGFLAISGIVFFESLRTI